MLSVKQARIWEEEELQRFERMIDDTTLPTVVIASIASLMNSHRELFRSKAEPSFENMKLKGLCKKSFSFLDAMFNFTGDNLHVQGWHLNGDTEPFENFITENVDSDLWQELKNTLEGLNHE